MLVFCVHDCVECRAHLSKFPRDSSRSRTRAPSSAGAGPAGRVVSRDGQFHPAVGRCHQERSRRRQRERLHRRRRRHQCAASSISRSSRSTSARSSAAQIINRLRPKLNRLPVASAFLQAAQDLRIGGRASNALYQYTIQADNVQDLSKWGPILLAEMKKLPGLQDVNSDQQNGGLEELADLRPHHRRQASASPRSPSIPLSTAPSANPKSRSFTPN